MLDMGFIHDVRKIVALCRGERQTLLFSATMPPPIAKLAHDILDRPARIDIAPAKIAVERIEQRVFFVGAKDLLEALLADGTPTALSGGRGSSPSSFGSLFFLGD